MKIINALDTFCKKNLEPFIDKSFQELAEYVNSYDQKMQMKRENIADRGIWTAKKRYILNVWDSEGVRYVEPKLKIMGVAAIQSTTPAICRSMLNDAYRIIMGGTEDEVIDYIASCRKKFKTLPAEEVSFPKSVSDPGKYKSHSTIYGKKSPIQVRAALLFNYHIKKNGLDKKYSLIGNGEKIKYSYLKLPNPIGENVIGFISEFPKELDLDKYIDYDTNFTKSFLDPLESILKPIGWKSRQVSSLRAFYKKK